MEWNTVLLVFIATDQQIPDYLQILCSPVQAAACQDFQIEPELSGGANFLPDRYSDFGHSGCCYKHLGQFLRLKRQQEEPCGFKDNYILR